MSNEACATQQTHKQRAQEVRDHYQRLSGRLQALRQLSSADRTLEDDLLTQLCDDTEGIQKYLARSLGVSFANSQPNEASTAKAQQVFQVPELLEMILLKLPPKSIFAAQQVCQTFSALISSSSKIQHYLGLKADLHCNFSTCFDKHSLSLWGGFQCRPEFDLSHRRLDWLRRRIHTNSSEPEPQSNTLEVTAKFSPHSKLPRLGKRCQSMLICQPPVYEMEATTACCNDRARRRLPGALPPVPVSIKSKTGITVGDILTASRGLWREHRLCAYADTSDLDEEGYVKVRPSFKALIHLKDGDPATEIQERLYKKANDIDQALTDRNRRLSAYVQAKRQGEYPQRVITEDLLTERHLSSSYREKHPHSRRIRSRTAALNASENRQAEGGWLALLPIGKSGVRC